MKRKLLLGLGLLLSAGFAKAQWANQTSSWSYGFSATTPSPSTVSSGTTNTTYLSSDALPVLPAPSSGTSLIFFTANTSSSVTIDATSNTLTMVPSVTGSVTKFSTYSVSGATELAYSKFTMTFSRTGATAPANNTAYVWSIGNRETTGNLYSNSTAVYQASGSAKSLFTALRWLYNSTNNNYALSYRVGSITTAQNYVTLSGGVYLPDVPYTFEVYANNSIQDKQYTKGANNYTVLAGHFHVWATNTQTSAVIRPYITGPVYDLPKAVETVSTTGDQSIPANALLNSFLFQGASNTGGYAKATINGGIELAYNQTTLPVSFTSFTGKKAANGIALNWATASEENNDYFEISRSNDGKAFTVIKTVKGKGTTSEANNYSFVDYSPVSGINYYQLKQVDRDGKSSVFNELVSVSYELNSDKLKVYTNGDKLNVSVYAEKEGAATLSVFDLQGKKVYTASVKLSAGQNVITLDASKIATGIYVANLVSATAVKSVKFTKK